MVGTFTYIGKNTNKLATGKSPILIRKAKDIKRRGRCAFYHNPNYGIGVVAHGTDFSYIYRSWSAFLRDWSKDD